jgi:hypothetical protein
MRRLSVLISLLTMALLAPALPATAHLPAGPGAYASAGTAAIASDNVRVGGRLYMYIAGGMQSTSSSSGEARTDGFAARGRCYELEKKNFKLTVCMASFRTRPIGSGAYTFDPALGSATLSMKDRRGDTKLTWAGRGVPSPDAGPAADPTFGAFAWAHVYRDARAKGTILGRHLELKGFDSWSFLDEGADAMVVTNGRDRLWRGSSGLYHLRTVSRTPLR